MFSWFRRPLVSLPPPPLPYRPEWADELAEALQKQARATAKQSARLDATLGEIDARIAKLSAAVAQPRAASEPSAAYELVFDALDALDEARARARDPHLADGLARVGERLARFCELRGYRRLTALGSEPDGNLMRVVGTEPSAELPPGRVLRVACAAIVRGDELVREGSVIVSTLEAEHE